VTAAVVFFGLQGDTVNVIAGAEGCDAGGVSQAEEQRSPIK